MLNIIKIVSKGIITGILAGYLLMYGLRPAVAYPDIILEPLEHNWMFIILFIINYYLFLWDLNVGVLMLLCIFALIFDILVFTHNGYQKVHNIVKKETKLLDFNKNNISYTKNIKEEEKNTIIDELIKLKAIQNESKLHPGDPSPFIL